MRLGMQPLITKNNAQLNFSNCTSETIVYGRGLLQERTKDSKKLKLIPFVAISTSIVLIY